MKRYDRRTFLKLSGASAVMLALSACEDEGFGGSGASDIPDSGSSSPPPAYDPFYSGEITTLGLRFRRLPIRPLFRCIRDGRKIFEIINAELTRRKVQYFKLQYNAGLEHSIQSEMQMFVDYDTPSFSAEEGLEARMNGDYVDGMWAGFDEGGYGWGRGSTGFIRSIHHNCYGIQLDHYREKRYYLDRPYPANQAQFKALMDELEGKFNYAPGPMDSQEVDVFDIGITVADVQGKTYWAAYIMRTPENPTTMNDEKETAMKHKRFAAVVLAAALWLTGCGGAAAPAAPANSGAAAKSTASTAVQTAQKERITDQFALEKNVSGVWGEEEVQYISVHVPQLECDSPDAVSLNKDLAAIYAADFREYEAYEEAGQPGGEYPQIGVGWDAYWYGDCVSLVVRSRYGGTAPWRYSGWCFDFATGQQITVAEMLQRMGLDPDTVQEQVQRQAMQAFDREMAQGAYYEGLRLGGELSQMRMDTLEYNELENLCLLCHSRISWCSVESTAVKKAGSSWIWRSR